MSAAAQAPAGRWVVKCDDYTVGPLPTQETAERRLEQIEDFGKCSNEHRVEEVR